jgi:signal transduction histidine kinase
VLAVFDTAPHTWSEDEIQILSLLAGQAAIALVKARLFEAARSRALHLASLNEIGQAIASTLDLDCVLRTLLEHIRQVTDAEACSVALVEPPSQPSPVFDGGEQGGCLVFRQAVGEVGPAVTGLRLKLGQGIAGWVAAHRQPTLVPDVTSDPRFHSEVDRNTGFITRDLVCVPLIVRDTVTGVLELINKHTGKFNEDEVRLLESVATQAAVAIENARLFQETRRRLNEMAVVSNVALVGAAGRPFDEAVASAVNALSSLWPDSKIGFLFVDETEQMLRAHPFSQYTQPEAAASLSIPLGQGITGWAARERQPVRVGDTSRDPRSAVAVPDIVSEMVAPMVVGERMIGVVSVVSSQLDAFSGDDLRLLTTLAGQLATIFEKARLDAKLAEHAATLEQQVQERTAQVQAQYARLRAILNSTSDGIIVTDTEGEILQANLVATRWLAQTLSVEDARRLREQVRSLAMRSGERPESVLELTGLDLQLHSAPIRDPQIERGAVVAVQDVSHLKALDRMKSRFVSNVSHELRTPLTAIKLCVTMLRTSPPEKQDKYLNMLEQEVDRQARLVEDVLQISRIEAGQFELRLRPIALHELAEAAVASRQMLAASRGLALEDHSDEPGPIVLVDPERMMEVVNNLVENAIRYTPEGGKIALSTGREQAGERLWAKLSVADTGIGIPEEELPYVFDRFFRGEKPQAMQIPGTGLGLSIVKEIAEMHGGQVTVQSRVGQGTLFAVWLPFVE